MSLILVAGEEKRYLRRDGVVVGPLIEKGTERFPFMDPVSRHIYTVQGRYFGDRLDSLLDLIREYPPELEIKGLDAPVWS